LIDKFFKSVSNWKNFDRNEGQVVLGLKSTADKEDYQFDYWNVKNVAKENGFRRVAASDAMVTFWRATHVSGPPWNRVKHIFDDRSVLVNFYSFQLESTEQTVP